jgi:DNA-binding beta-propeller fold protein YncE
VSETQALYVSNDGSNAITAYTAHGRELGFSVSGSSSGLDGPEGLAFDPVTGWLYAANFGNTTTAATITAYDPATGAQVPSSSFSASSGLSNPYGLAFDPQTGWLYAANLNGGTNGTITAYDPATGAQVPSSSFSATSGLDFPYGLAYDPQTGWLYAANIGNSTITAYNPSTGAEISSTSFTSPTSSDGISFPTFLLVLP